jgi:protein-disulfide isomerase
MFLTLGVGIACSLISALPAQIPSAPVPEVSAPTAQGPATAQAPAFPPVDPRNFTSASPTAAEVDSFLKELWGYDENRVWEVAAVEKTEAPGVSKVVVFVDEKGQTGKGTQSMFFTLADGKHAIAGEVTDFGAHPFAEKRALLAAEANGPSHGAKSNDLEIVEFADLQCEHCKEAQDTMDQIATDFPEAKIVFENFPLVLAHPYAFQAAAEGDCLRKAKGDDAFFVYARAVFATQGGLTAERHDATLAAAATKAGADPAAAAACATSGAAKATVDGSTKLAMSVGVNQTPMIAVNGWLLPISQIRYDVLKQMIAYRAKLDGVTTHPQPTLSNLK